MHRECKVWGLVGKIFPGEKKTHSRKQRLLHECYAVSTMWWNELWAWGYCKRPKISGLFPGPVPLCRFIFCYARTKLEVFLAELEACILAIHIYKDWYISRTELLDKSWSSHNIHSHILHTHHGDPYDDHGDGQHQHQPLACHNHNHQFKSNSAWNVFVKTDIFHALNSWTRVGLTIIAISIASIPTMVALVMTMVMANFSICYSV